MEKLQPVLQALYKHRFWITCGLVAVASVITWYMAWSGIDKARDERVTKLNSKKSSITSVIKSTVPKSALDAEDEPGLNVHPNEETEKGMQERIKVAAEGALEAWEERYKKQQELLKFAPDYVDENDRLPNHVVEKLESHNPMELPLESELLELTQRQTYKWWIARQMPALASKIGTKWPFDRKGDEIEFTNPEEQAAFDAAVDLIYWNDKNKELWNSKITEFTGWDGNFEAEPSSQQMLALQQDLWILAGIFDAMSSVNEGFSANDLAPIKALDHIYIGREGVAKDVGEVTTVSGEAVTSAPKRNRGSSELTSSKKRKSSRAKASRSRKSRKAKVFNPAASESPFHGRYVNRDYSQLDESVITEAITSDELTDQSYLAVAKRVPVRIALQMDERRINDFLAAAANSPFAFEIRQVRINQTPKAVDRVGKSQAASNTKKKGGPPAGPSIGGDGPAEADGPGGGGGGGAGGGSGVGADFRFRHELRGDFNIRIEFIGIVKIYNPVSRSLFFPEEKPDNPDATPGANR